MPGARVDSTVCGRCRKKLQPDDRVVYAGIIERIGSHPQNLAVQGAWLLDGGKEFELVHIDCRDPDLTKGILP